MTNEINCLHIKIEVFVELVHLHPCQVHTLVCSRVLGIVVLDISTGKSALSIQMHRIYMIFQETDSMSLS